MASRQSSGRTDKPKALPEQRPKLIVGETPREQGFRWPAEWEKHEATILCWPHDPQTWRGCLTEAQEAYAEFVAAVASSEAVHLLVKNAATERVAVEMLRDTSMSAAHAKRVQLHRIQTADAWVRDTGPIVVVRGRGKSRERLALDVRFNAWGDKYAELLRDDRLPRKLAPLLDLPRKRSTFVLEGGSIEGNGKGTIITSEQCLLHTNRNPSLSRFEIEQHLRELLGVRHILWLGDGIAGDDTDGHVDDMTRFVGPRTVVTAVEPDAQDENFRPLAENLDRLRAMSVENGTPLEVIPLPMPGWVQSRSRRRLPASYANFYIANRVVCVPVFDDPADDYALKVLRHCFPRKRVVPIASRHLIEGFGSLHCLSQQVPA